MQVTRSKLVALVIALGYFVTAVVVMGWAEKAAILGYLLSLPLAFIWFPDAIASYTVWVVKHGFRFTTPTPAPVVTIVGWLWLVGYLPLMAYLWSR